MNPTSFSFLFSETHCGEFVCRDFFLALCDGVEEQVLQAGQDACLPSPAGKTNKKHTHRTQSEKNNSTVRRVVVETWRGFTAAEGGEKAFLTARRSNCNTALENTTLHWPYFSVLTCGKGLNSTSRLRKLFSQVLVCFFTG